MSNEPIPPSAGGDKLTYKSYKKKYRKLKYTFDQVMKKSDELFRNERKAAAAVRRLAEENTRLLDNLVDLNASSHVPKSRRCNIGSPSRPSPPRLMSPTLLASITGGDSTLFEHLGDMEPMDLDQEEDVNSSSESDDDNVRVNAGSKYNSDDEVSDDDNEAYLEEIRETNYKRGIPGTPPRAVREKLKADEEREEQAKIAAAAAASKTTANNLNSNGAIGQDGNDIGLQDPPHTPPRPLILEDVYRPGMTPPFLRDPSPFLLSLEEEENFYFQIDELHGGAMPTSRDIEMSPTIPKAESDPRNPMSVYCWLRKYQPQVFLQEHEGDKRITGGRGRGGGRRKTNIDELSGDEIGQPAPSKPAGQKRRRTIGAGETSARGGKGKRKQADGEPVAKKQRSGV